MKTDLKENVRAFHQMFGMNDPTSPTVPADDVVRLRAKLITEEYFETMRALFRKDSTDFDEMGTAERAMVEAIDLFDVDVDLPDFIVGLADLEYVCEGSFLTFGIDAAPIHAEVQRSNMAEAGSEVCAYGKRLKLACWTPPDIAGEIEKQRIVV